VLGFNGTIFAGTHYLFLRGEGVNVHYDVLAILFLNIVEMTWTNVQY